MRQSGTVIPAPYITNPERLVSRDSLWTYSGFLRICDVELKGPGIDIFFAGDAPAYRGLYQRDSPRQWLTDYAAMENRQSSAPLAGYFSYEFGFQYEPKRWAELPIDDGQSLFHFVEMQYWYEVNHHTSTAKIHSAPGTSPQGLKRFADYVKTCSSAEASESQSVILPAISDEQLASFGEFSKSEYQDIILQILEDIRAGRYYELNFTQRFAARSQVAPADLFAQLLQRLNPAYAFYGHLGDEYIVSASPELFLHKKDNLIKTCPIKGSFRGIPTQDERDKLAAEHIMVVDLARNDLGRICDLDWVRVEEQSAEKQFGAITHLESCISGKTSRPFNELMAATCPAASITGMPKVIAVQSIASYERTQRGVYTGNCGVLWPNGDFQLNVAIRTLQAHAGARENEWEYTLGAGGAITADSDPGQEYSECLAKVRPLIELLGLKET